MVDKYTLKNIFTLDQHEISDTNQDEDLGQPMGKMPIPAQRRKHLRKRGSGQYNNQTSPIFCNSALSSLNPLTLNWI